MKWFLTLLLLVVTLGADAQVKRYNDLKSINNGLVAWWTFDVDGTDRSGTGNTGTLKNHAFIVAGKFGNAVSLDGTDDYVDCGNDASLNLYAGGVMSVSCWIKLAALPGVSSYFDVVGKWYSGGSSYELWIYNNNSWYDLRFSTVASSSNAGIAVFSSLTAGVWYHLVGVHTGGKSYAYINGVVGATVGTESFAGSTGSTRIGYHSPYFNGLIDDVRIYNRALSASEISLLAASGGVDGNYDGLVGWWPMSEGSGTSLADRAGAHTGTLEGTVPSWVDGKFGKCLSFNGGSGRVSLGAYVLGTGNISVSAWVKATDFGESGAGRIIDCAGTGTGAMLWVRSSTGGFGFSSNGASTIAESAANAIVTGAWQHIVITRTSAGVANLYLNGVLTGSANQASGTPVVGSTNDRIGCRYDGNRGFNGLIEDVRYWNRVLGIAEIKAMFFAKKAQYQ